jgi:hypothetical protein
MAIEVEMVLMVAVMAKTEETQLTQLQVNEEALRILDFQELQIHKKSW